MKGKVYYIVRPKITDMLTFKNDAESYKKIFDKASLIRGSVINETIVAERIMDKIISEYFCPDKNKATELVMLIVSTKRMTFESKRQVLKWIVDNRIKMPKKYNKEALYSELKKIEIHRNIFAHYILDTSGEGINMLDKGKIRFLEIINDAKYVEYDAKKLKEVLDLTKKCQRLLIEVLDKNISPAQ